MIRAITIIVLFVFLPVQVHAAVGFDFDPIESELIIKPPVIHQERPVKDLNDKLIEMPPQHSSVAKSRTNWWLWGTVGLLAVAGGVLALSVGGSKGGGSSNKGVGASTSTVTGSW